MTEHSIITNELSPLNSTTTYQFNINKYMTKFRKIKFLCIAIINAIFPIALFINKTEYTENFTWFMYLYYIQDVIYILYYSAKIRIGNKHEIILLIISCIYRLLLFGFSVYGFICLSFQINKGFLFYYFKVILALNISLIIFVGIMISIITTSKYTGGGNIYFSGLIFNIIDDSFDIKPFDKKLKMKGFNAETCVICHIDFIENENLKILPCRHYYHIQCINQWIKDNKSCPICRKIIQV